jgi:thiol-disulfide isomerase/thioredoxin
VHNRVNIGRIVTLLGALLLVQLAQAGRLEVYDGLLESPPLALNDLGNHSHDLMDYRGQVMLINFWATWCPPCIIEMPSMQRLKDKLTSRPFRILAVNVKESEGTIWKFHKLVKVDFPLLLDRDGQASEDWQVVVYPSSFLVDTRGNIRYQATGMLEWDSPEVVQVIEAMLDEVPAEGAVDPAGANSFAIGNTP